MNTVSTILHLFVLFCCYCFIIKELEKLGDFKIVEGI